MTVLIHALGAKMGGAVRHLSGFLPELGKADPHERYIVVLRESFPAVSMAENVTVERVPDAAASGWATRIAGDCIELPLRLRRQKVSAIVSLFNFGPIWSPAPHILYQSNAIYYCPHYLEGLRGRLRLEIALRARLALASMKRADVIVTPSDAMADMIRARRPEIRGRRFHTLFRGFSKDGMEDPPLARQAELLASAKGWRFLYPTHVAAHKGFDVLLDALVELKSQGLAFQLVTTIADELPEFMEQTAARIKQLKLQDHVVIVGRTPQSQMGALYAHCDLMVYSSLCESFGFPLVEAMGYGLPIVAAGTAVNRELCQGGAAYYSPFDATAAARAINEALEPASLQRLREAGAARIASFDWSWARYAREFVQIVRSVL